jgi:uncharacterized protein (TIGR00725 family)
MDRERHLARELRMELRERPRIGVIGAGSPSPEDLLRAEEVGRLVGAAGAILVCGGLGGVMEAAARGAREAGGFTMGLLPGTDHRAANPHIQLGVATGLGHARNALVAQNADVLIAVGGHYGTLSEIALGKVYGRPVVGLGSWKIDGVLEVTTAAAAVRQALELAAR